MALPPPFASPYSFHISPPLPPTHTLPPSPPLLSWSGPPTASVWRLSLGWVLFEVTQTSGLQPVRITVDMYSIISLSPRTMSSIYQQSHMFATWQRKEILYIVYDITTQKVLSVYVCAKWPVSFFSLLLKLLPDIEYVMDHFICFSSFNLQIHIRAFKWDPGSLGLPQEHQASFYLFIQ